MTAAPDMKPEMTVWEMKLVIHPRLNMPTRVYITPAKKATCRQRSFDKSGDPKCRLEQLLPESLICGRQSFDKASMQRNSGDAADEMGLRIFRAFPLTREPELMVHALEASLFLPKCCHESVLWGPPANVVLPQAGCAQGQQMHLTSHTL